MNVHTSINPTIEDQLVIRFLESRCAIGESLSVPAYALIQSFSNWVEVNEPFFAKPGFRALRNWLLG